MKVIRGLGGEGDDGDSPSMTPTRTHLSRLIQAAMDEQNLTQGDIERRGGPSKQTTGQLLSTWSGKRSLDPATLEKLSKALGVSRRSLGRAAAIDMGLIPADEAKDDGLALLTDALRERASDRQRELVIAAARAVWRVLEQQDQAAVEQGLDPDVEAENRRADRTIDAALAVESRPRTVAKSHKRPLR